MVYKKSGRDFSLPDMVKLPIHCFVNHELQHHGFTSPTT